MTAPAHRRRRVVLDEEAALSIVLGIGILLAGPMGFLAIRQLVLGGA